MTPKEKKSSYSHPEKEAPERIIEAAIHAFARQGYDGTSTKDICEAAGVNIAAIHYHFTSKEELFRHIIERFGGARLESVQRILAMPKTREELRIRLDLFLSESLETFIHQPEICRIVQTEIELLQKRSEKVFLKTFVKLFETLVNFLKHARKEGLLSPDIDPKIAAQFLFNQLRQVTRGDGVNTKFFGMSIRESAFRSLWLRQTLEIFLRGVGAFEPPRPKTLLSSKNPTKERI